MGEEQPSTREILFAFLATRPEFAKPKSCRRKLVGPMRQYLWSHGGAQSGLWPDAPPHALALIASRGEAGEMLADFCARCGRCDWSKQWGVTTAPLLPDTDPGADHGH